MLVDKTKYTTEIPLKFLEGKEFGELIQLIVALQCGEAVGRMSGTLELSIHIVANSRIGKYRRG